MSFFNELKRRNVFKVAAAYIIVGWLIMQAGDTLAPALHLPEWINSALVFFLILGFPIAMFFAWAFELTPEGLKKEKEVDRTHSITHVTGRKLDFAIIGLMAIALGYFAFDKFVLDPQRDAVIVQTAQQATDEDAVPGLDDKSIVVLPFVNMSSDPEQEYFSDGLSEELMNLLAKIPELKVTSRSSAFSFKGQNIDIPTVAAKLKVAHVLEGSVRKAGNRVRITAQLIKADSDVHMWSETYDRELDDVFAIQDEIAQAVVSVLQIKLLGVAPTSAKTDTKAYTFYLQGKHFDSLSTDEGWQSAEAAYREALAIDPDYSRAWAGLSLTLRSRANFGHIDLHEGTESARQAAERALEIDENLAEAWSALARIQFVYDWDWDRARGTILTALQHGPRHADALQNAATIFRGLGWPDEAVDYARRALETDPLSRSALRTLGVTYWAVGRHADSRTAYRQMLALYPEQVDMHAFTANSLMLDGKPEEALHELSLEKHEFWVLFAESMILHSLGRYEEADQVTQRYIEENHVGFAFQFADIFAWQSKPDQAFEWLEIASENHDGGFSQILSDPFLVSLQQDSRWEPLLLKVGLLNYWYEMQARKASDEL